MPYLAAFASATWDIEHVDEDVQDVDFSRHYDLVAMTFHTPSAQHAYELCSQFRKRGVTVAVGGPHVTLLPDEAQQHADVVFVGEAEATWPQFLGDFEQRRYAQRYTCPAPPDLAGVPPSRQELFHRRDRAGGIMFATRGCPSRCEFCAIAVMYRGGLRK